MTEPFFCRVGLCRYTKLRKKSLESNLDFCRSHEHDKDFGPAHVVLEVVCRDETFDVKEAFEAAR